MFREKLEEKVKFGSRADPNLLCRFEGYSRNNIAIPLVWI